MLTNEEAQMRRFFKLYWSQLKVLPQNIFLYVWFLAIICGDQRIERKILMLVLSFFVIPLFQMWSTRLQKTMSSR